jgi:Na+/H+ antiporter NhaA
VTASSETDGTGWAGRAHTPLREFLHTETGSAVLLVAAAVAALIWSNVSASSYNAFWHVHLGAHAGRYAITLDLREFVNSGLMTFFFLIIGLEARREFDMGELRERSRLTLPLLAGLGGMAAPALIYLAIGGDHAPDAWGVTISTDTAFALGALALASRNLPDRIRTFLLTISVVDDLAVIAVIAIFYSYTIEVGWLVAGLAFLSLMAAIRMRGVRSGPTYLVIGICAWVSFFASGVDPILVGLVFGMLSYAYPASQSSMRRATTAFREFRQQPTPELARTAGTVVRSAVSPNDRLVGIFHPWTSFLIVPLFALANTGITLSASFLRQAFGSVVTIGILVGYVVGKPAGTIAGTWLVGNVTRNKPPTGWGGVAGVGAASGVGFTIALLIADKALTGDELADAKLGILVAAVAASLLTWLVFRVVTMLPKRRRLRALYGEAEVITDLAVPVDLGRDHWRGPDDATVTIVEYGDFECEYCGQAEVEVRSLLRDAGDVRYVWRHLPLEDVHPHAYLAALATEAAAAQGAFWEMHDLLLDDQEDLSFSALLGYAEDLGLDMSRFEASLARQVGAERIAEDIDSADLSGVSGIPTFFVNGVRHYGAYDAEALIAAVRTAHTRAHLQSLSRGPATILQ